LLRGWLVARFARQREGCRAAHLFGLVESQM
jgi:hypothetical protein